MRRIVAGGHELASHGWDHRRVHTMTAPEFRLDLSRARQVLEDAGGVRITGYRAPSFSIDARTPWAHAELAEAGYGYSSSVAPLRHDHYGWPESPRWAWRPVADADLIELPVTLAQFGRRRIAVGGGFSRLLPAMLTRHAIAQAETAGHAAQFYFHPWEIDPGQPRVVNASLRSKLRHYSRLSAMSGKLSKLLVGHDWGRVDATAAIERDRLSPSPGGAAGLPPARSPMARKASEERAGVAA
jgi:polysaccharide deacetylase family protein (PEP-CTERM system associated)